jgi:predicted KAP-like P-loop ATPase
LHDTLHFH